MATFIGIDLAWTERNPSGGAVIRDGRLIAWRGDLGDLSEIERFVAGYVEPVEGTIVAVDAPLRVPNVSGSRPAEKALNRDWARFEAGAHPANRRLLARGGQVRGEALVGLLTQRMRFSEAAQIPRHSTDRLICEVYPHPAHVSLFGLEKTLKYKRGNVAQRRQELERYQQLLLGLRKGTPPLKKIRAALKSVDVADLQGKALKTHEDSLDAITCAYIGYYLWWHGPRRATTYGTLAEGHIIVPVTKAMRERLKPPK
jgi:predicted RNase H-like nuclease